MIAFAHKEWLLTLLLPFAVFLVWRLRNRVINKESVLMLWVVTVVLVWGLLYILYSLEIFYDPHAIFASVEDIMQGSEREWALRYLSERFGWVPASLYFAVCWGIARIVS